MLLNSQIYKNYPEGKLKPHWVIIYSGMVQKVDIKLCGPESPDPPSGSPSGDRLRSREGVHLVWDSHIKMTVVSEILKRAQRGTKILFFRHGLNFISPFRGTNSNTLLSYIVFLFSTQVLQSSSFGPFESEVPKRY